MGYGDQLMATGMAKGAAARGKRIAFGDGNKILWDHHSETIFRGNPNIAPPGSEGSGGLHWIPFYRGNRIYNRQVGDRWVWNYDFRPAPGEMFFSDDELSFARKVAPGFVLIEPNLPDSKTSSPNKDWGARNYAKTARLLHKAGFDVAQFLYKGGRDLEYARKIKTPTFRHAMAVLKNAELYIGPEGGLHHAAAAVGVPAVVLFGGFIPPSVTGYATHINLTGGPVACGSLTPCEHCRSYMDAISVTDVLNAAQRFLKVAA